MHNAVVSYRTIILYFYYRMPIIELLEDIMKKIIAAVLILAGMAVGCFAEKTSSTGFQFGIGSGYVFYGDSGVRDLISDMNSDDFSRFILSGDAGFYAAITDNVQFVTEAEMLSDLFWKGSDHCYFLDYAFLAGIKAYPGLGGLSCSVSYALGRRTDIVKMNGNDTNVSSTSWGNGYKFCVEYDMKYGSKGVAPVIGTYLRHMPRGGSSDNTLSVYFRFIFR